MAKKTLNGRWYSKEDPDTNIFVERVFKKGYVTGFKYTSLPGGGEAIGGLKISHEELNENYQREPIK